MSPSVDVLKECDTVTMKTGKNLITVAIATNRAIIVMTTNNNKLLTNTTQ